MKTLLTTIVVLLFVVFSGFPQGGKEPDTDSMMMMSSSEQEETTGDMMSGDAVSTKGIKLPFTDLEAASVLAEKGPIILFFYATWCPTCQVAMKNIDDNIAKLKGITIVVVDYDKEKELKKQYKVTYQHTFVIIDKNGGKLDIWNGGGADTILKRVEAIKEG